MKICSTCKIEKSLDSFYFRKDSNSYRNSCKVCQISQVSIYSKANKHVIKEKNKKYHKKRYDNPEIKQKILNSNKNYYSQNKEKHQKLRQDWYSNNKEQYLMGRKKYYQLNKKEFRARDNKRRAIEINARPIWVNNKEIQDFYKNCPEGFEVDHIVPLNNKLVCGLDVIWNLQYLTVSENRKKSNKFEVNNG